MNNYSYANLLYTSIESWFTTTLLQYAWSLNPLPPTQIATQRGLRVDNFPRSDAYRGFPLSADHIRSQA